MESFKADVVIVGAGGAGLRAAIAVAEADPGLAIALVSKVYPMLWGGCSFVTGAGEGPSGGRPRADWGSGVWSLAGICDGVRVNCSKCEHICTGFDTR